MASCQFLAIMLSRFIPYLESQQGTKRLETRALFLRTNSH
jgi:hypothetical protein